MSFATPSFFYLLLLIPLTGMIFFWDYLRRRSLLNKLFSLRARREVINAPSLKKSFLRMLLLMLFFSGAVTALARPRWGEKIEMLPQRNLNLYFLLDCSLSMRAPDLDPSRFEAAKRLIAAIANRLTTDQLALVNFAAAPYLQCPLTFDSEAFKIMLEISAISPTSEQGTDFGKLFQFCLKIAKTEPEGINVLVLVSDGEDHLMSWKDKLRELKGGKLPVYAIGVGSTAMATIPLDGPSGNEASLKRDRNGNVVYTALRAGTLQEISKITGGSFFHYRKSGDIAAIVDSLRKIVAGELNRKYRKIPKERFYYPLAAAMIFLTAFLAVPEGGR